MADRVELYVPGTQLVHAVEPTMLAKVPCKHCVQLLAGASKRKPYLPKLQEKQLNDVVEPMLGV